MKRLLCLVLAVISLAGCGKGSGELEQAMELRGRLSGSSAQFSAEVTADYGDQSYTFTMDCEAEADGTLTFAVTQPDTLAGISGNISGPGGKLTFDDVALAFDHMAQGRLSPISGPWVMMKALRSGFLTSCGMEEDGLRVSIDDSYEDDALRLEIWLDEAQLPKLVEIYWQGRRLLTIKLTSFRIL